MGDLVITNDKAEYVARNFDNSLYVTTNKNKALRGTNYTKLSNILATLPKFMRGRNFYIKIEQSDEENSKRKAKYFCCKKTDSTLLSFQSEIDALVDENKDLCEQLSLCDKALLDLEHYIEFSKFSASEGYKISKMMKDILTTRREVKNKLKIINVLKRTRNELNGIKTQTYNPRILKDLFKKGVDEEWEKIKTLNYYCEEKINS